MDKKEGIEKAQLISAKQQVTLISTTPHTDYSDYVHLVATSEEFILEFGNRNTSNPAEILISKRIALSIFHAKRLTQLLLKNIKAYEDKFGEIKETLDRLSADERKKMMEMMERGNE